MDRRTFLRGSLCTLAGAAAAGPVGSALWSPAHAAPVVPGTGPYGPLRAANEQGLRLPDGFSSRIIAVSGIPVADVHDDPGLEHAWHPSPAGGACFVTPDGGWVYVSNAGAAGQGGASAVRFSSEGTVNGAYPILSDTERNAAGGATPWGTWLSCEPTGAGRVWECDPSREGQGVARPALGVFAHASATVDPDGRHVYLTEDADVSGLYRFTPEFWPDLSSGLLEIAVIDEDGATEWVEVPDPSAATGRTAHQVPEAAILDVGAGIVYDAGFLYFATRGTDQVWVHDTRRQRTTVLYDVHDHRDTPLTGVDHLAVGPSGDLLVAEDGGNLELVIATADTREIAPLLRLEGVAHNGSAISGPAFSPDGSRLYFSSQRSSPPAAIRHDLSLRPDDGLGLTFEVTGPFRRERVGMAAVGAAPTATPSPSPSAASPSPSRTASPEPPAATPITPPPHPSASAAPRDDGGAGDGWLPGVLGVLGAGAFGYAVRRRRGTGGADREGSGE